MRKNIAACGANCGVCESFETCGGCKKSEGKAFYLAGNTCPLYECAIKKVCKDCGGCDIKKCEKFMSYKDPKMSEDEFKKLVDKKINNLKELRDSSDLLD